MIQHFLSNLWRWKCGLPELELNQAANFDPASQWSREFEALMRARLIMGAYRYGPVKAPGKPRYDRTSAIRKRLTQYESTGNGEALVDCANLLMLEFVESDHPNFHFEVVDDSTHVDLIQ